MLDVTVDDRVRVKLPPGPIGDSAREKLIAEFTHPNHRRERMRKVKARGWWAEPAVYATWGEIDGVLSLPRGLGMAAIRRVAAELGEGYVVTDSRTSVPVLDFPDLLPEFQLDPHQERIVIACTAKQNCLVKAGTGSGKTVALLALASVLKQKTLVIVHSNGLADQWVEQAEDKLGIPKKAIGRLGDGHRSVGRWLTIGTQKSVQAAMADDPNFRHEFGMVLADEVHLFAAASFIASVDPFTAKYRVGASDSEKRKDGKEFLVYDEFGGVACEVSDAEVIECGRTMDVEVLVVPTEFRADWYGRGNDDDKSPDYGRLLEAMANDLDRNALIERLMITEIEDGHQVLVFGSHREHCRVLGAMAASRARAGYLIGGADYKTEFARTKKGLKDGSIRLAVGTYQACGTGIDIPGVEVGIAATPALSNRQKFRQGRGRVCRKPVGKTVARFYVLFDGHVFGLSQLENASRWGGHTKTFVWSDERWVPVREYLRRARGAA